MTLFVTRFPKNISFSIRTFEVLRSALKNIDFIIFFIYLEYLISPIFHCSGSAKQSHILEEVCNRGFLNMQYELWAVRHSRYSAQATAVTYFVNCSKSMQWTLLDSHTHTRIQKHTQAAVWRAESNFMLNQFLLFVHLAFSEAIFMPFSSPMAEGVNFCVFAPHFCVLGVNRRTQLPKPKAYTRARSVANTQALR